MAIRAEGARPRSPLFEDEAEAARAYDRMAVEVFGEFARLNFPEEWPAQRRQEVYAQRDVAAKTKGRSRKATPARKSKDKKGETCGDGRSEFPPEGP